MKKMRSPNDAASETFAENSLPRADQSCAQPPRFGAEAARRWLSSIKRRAIAGLLLLAGLFLLYRFIWLTAWYWPYRLISDYLRSRLPIAEPWMIESAALLACALLVAQAGAILSFIFLGRQKRVMIALIIIGAVLHGALGWYAHSRVVIDERGRVRVRIVERPDGTLKVVDSDFDPQTGKRARTATESDLVMLDLQRRGIPVREVGPTGPFRSAQGTINVYYTQRGGRVVLYTGPRHPDVSGDMPIATDEILREFLAQQRRK
jgi:hypothetical protein